jgi:hypothetical protein
MCEKIEKCDPYVYDPREVVNIAAVYKIPNVLLSSQALRPMYDPQHPSPADTMKWICQTFSIAIGATDNVQII